MKLTQVVSLVLAIQFTAFSLQALELGNIIISGSGCYGSTIVSPITSEGRLLLPIRVSLNKKAATAFDRKTCNIRIPVTLNKSEKLQILDVSQSVRVIAAKGAGVKSSLNVSLVGQRTSDLTLAVDATTQHTSIVKTLKSERAVVVAESECGEDAVIAGNLNVLATGQAKALATTSSAQLTLRVVSCKN